MSAGPTKIAILLTNHVAETSKYRAAASPSEPRAWSWVSIRSGCAICSARAGVAEPHGSVALGFSCGPLQDVSLVGNLSLHVLLAIARLRFSSRCARIWSSRSWAPFCVVPSTRPRNRPCSDRKAMPMPWSRQRHMRSGLTYMAPGRRLIPGGARGRAAAVRGRHAPRRSLPL